MAKDFSKLEENNPVMAILGKAKAEEEQKTVEQILAPSKVTVTETPVQDEESQKEEVQETEIKKILMNISIRETTKKEWKMFFLEHDLSMTQGIETAVEYLRSEVEKGNIRLTKGGITK